MTIKIKKNCINCKNLTYEWGDVGDPEGYVCTRKDFQGKDEDEMIYNMNRQEYLEKAKVCFVSNKGEQMSDGHNQCMPTFELKDIDYCMSKGRVSKKRTEKVLKNKNDEIEKLKERLKEAESILKNIQDEHELDFTHIREYQEKYQKG